MSTNDSVFNFDLSESLFFEGNQGVQEIINISLDPEISIQSFNDYISIRGVILLQGKYHQIEVHVEEEEELSSFEDYNFKRHIESVIDLEDGVALLSHRFPVEISVPAYRVNDLDDVTVSIVSFDYELPDPQKIIVNARIEIHGIQNEQMNVQTRTTSHTEMDIAEYTDDENDEVMDDTFHFEIKKKEQDQEEKEIKDDVVNMKEGIRSEETEENQQEKEEDITGRWLKKKSQTFEEFFSKETNDSKNKSEDDVGGASSDNELSVETFDEEEVITHEVEINEQATQAVKDDESESADLDENQPERLMDVSYLSDMIRNEQETFTKMRLCIVQKDDTLESIAERYETTTFHIIKRNRLDEDSAISEGQLLYVPFKKSKTREEK